MQPLNPAAHNVLGLASEARGDLAAAAAAFRLALRLLLQVGREPEAAVQHPGAVPGTNTALMTGARAPRVARRRGTCSAGLVAAHRRLACWGPTA